MHELSIAASIVEAATRHVREAGGGGVATVTVRIGVLAGVSEAALRTGFEFVRADTLLSRAELRVIVVPLAIWCPTCDRAVEPPGPWSLSCPACGTRSGDIRGGRELDLESIELHAPAAAAGVGP